MRRVLYKQREDDKEVEVKEGVFHQWSGTMMDAYALVETPDGKIVRVEQEDIQFIEGWKR